MGRSRIRELTYSCPEKLTQQGLLEAEVTAVIGTKLLAASGSAHCDHLQRFKNTMPDLLVIRHSSYQLKITLQQTQMPVLTPAPFDTLRTLRQAQDALRMRVSEQA